MHGHVARQLFWHMRGALSEGEAPPEAWLTHQDEAVLRQVALAVGLDALVGLADSAEAAGALVVAGRFLWVASKARAFTLGSISSVDRSSTPKLQL